ncbi:MAG TPA: PAS domain-containing sensor histidine kinase, partial [Archangium sp.]|nr:PAS domain-containing sensor histidine kinase [Archangium sp.]
MELATRQVWADALLLEMFGLGGTRTETVPLDAVLAGIHPEDRGRAAEAISKALAGEQGGRYAADFRTLAADGRIRWVEGRGQVLFDADGKPVRFIGTGLDITARKVAEQAVWESENLMKEITDALPVMISFVGPDMRYRFVNRIYEDWIGLERSEMIGRTIGEVVGQAAEDAVRPMATRALAGETVTFDRRTHYKIVGPLDVRVTYVPHYNAAREIDGFIALVADMSEIKKKEDELQRRSEFEQQLIGIVSHDLRNPVAAIKMSTVLLQRMGLDEKQAKIISRIASSTERASRMISDLLDFTQARLGSGLPVHRAHVDLHRVTDTVVDELRVSAPDQQIVVKHSGDATGAFDAERIAQAVGNLIGNALKFSLEDAAITLEVRGEAGAVVLSVHNRGEPIPAELFPHLFTPLHRGKDTGKGVRSIGLGLYIVDQIVKSHGGDVQVTSTREDGTRFTLRLPRGP